MLRCTIRRAGPADAGPLVQLNSEFNGLDLPLPLVRQRLSRTTGEAVFLAEADHEAIGYACARHLVSVCYPRPWIEITEVYVRAGYRQQGVGVALMRAIEKHARRRGADQIVVRTGQDNTEGQRLFASAGYHGKPERLFHKSLAASPAEARAGDR